MRHALPLLALALAVRGADAQDIPVAIDADGVNDISLWATTIEKDKARFRRIERELPANPRNGTVRLYMQGSNLRKIEATYPTRQGRLTRHYYLANDDRLKLVILRESQYDSPRSERVAARRVEMLWFASDSVLYWLAPDGRGVAGPAPDATARAEEVMFGFRALMSMRAVQNR